MKRMFTIALIAVSSCFAFAACAPPDESSDEESTTEAETIGEVQEAIGVSPNCQSPTVLMGKYVARTACGTCPDGLKSDYYEACLGPGVSNPQWKLIRANVCTPCDGGLE